MVIFILLNLDIAADFDPLSSFYSPWTSQSQKSRNLKDWEDKLISQARSTPKWCLDLENQVIVYEDNDTPKP